MKSCYIQIPSAQLACEIYGDGEISLVIEMGLGAVMAEWRRLAEKIEKLWQDIMGAYLTCAKTGTWIRAEHSSHYIHLTDPELICTLASDT